MILDDAIEPTEQQITSFCHATLQDLLLHQGLLTSGKENLGHQTPGGDE